MIPLISVNSPLHNSMGTLTADNNSAHTTALTISCVWFKQEILSSHKMILLAIPYLAKMLYYNMYALH